MLYEVDSPGIYLLTAALYRQAGEQLREGRVSSASVRGVWLTYVCCLYMALLSSLLGPVLTNKTNRSWTQINRSSIRFPPKQYVNPF